MLRQRSLPLQLLREPPPADRRARIGESCHAVLSSRAALLTRAVDVEPFEHTFGGRRATRKRPRLPAPDVAALAAHAARAE